MPPADPASRLRQGGAGLARRVRRWLRIGPGVADLRRRVSDLEGQLAALGPALAGTAAGRSAEQALHQVTARRYRQFLDQDLMAALHRAGPGAPPPGPARSRWSAELGRDICACAFAAPVVARAALDDLLVGPAADQLADEARRLRGDVAALPASPWVFGCVPGTRLDPAYQDPWGGCDPDAPGRWVVAPAYVAHGVVIVRQRVYTCP